MVRSYWCFVFAILLDCLNISFPFKFMVGNCPLVVSEPCDPNWISFYFSTRRHDGSNYIYELDPYKPKIQKGFNVLTPLKLVIHGYGGFTIDTASNNVTKSYQDKGANIIIVDWEPLASVPCYATAYLNTWHVGECVALLAKNLIPYGITPDLTHVVGFSLGAHIAGFAGTNVNRSTGTQFYRITGLDPALPFFATLNNDWKLDRSDAQFVDIIHTSAGLIGKIEATGHVDYYVNGGSLQPFCYNFRYPPLCSHILAGLYFAESIRNETYFVGRQCDNYPNYMLGRCNNKKTSLMGEFTDKTARGIFHVTTSNQIPFGNKNPVVSRLRRKLRKSKYIK